MVVDLLKDPGPNNIAWAWIKALMPEGDTTALGVAFSVFSSTLVFLGAFVIAWTLIAAIVSAASSGTVLGNKYHHIWAPLRLVVGMGLMIPIFGGWSASHYAARDIVARPAINLADATWLAYVTSVVQKRHNVVAVGSGGPNLVRDILESEICAAVNNELALKAGRAVPPVRLPTSAGELQDGARHWKWGDRCGAVSIPVAQGMPGFTADREAAVEKIIASMREAARPYGEYFNKFGGVRTREEAISLFVSDKLPMLLTRLRNLGAGYDNAITAAAQRELALDKDAAERNEKITKAAEQEGFVTAGMYWGALSRESARLTDMTGTRHIRTKIANLDVSGTGASVKDSGQPMVKAALDALDVALGAEQTDAGLTANDLAASADSDSDLFSKIMNPVKRSLGEWALSKKGDEGDTIVQTILKTDPIADQISSGHAFMGIAEVGIIAALIPIVAAFTSPADWAGLDGAAMWAMGWIGPQLATLWIIGAVRAYILPVLPAIYMVLFAVTWLLAFLEMMVLLVVWAFGFLTMKGEEALADASKMGATLLFMGLLMPAVGMLAFMATFVILLLAIGTAEVFWAKMFYGNVGTPGLPAVFIGLVIITFLTMYLAVKIFGQILMIPQRIQVWLGQSPNGFGDGGMMLGTATAMTALLNRGVPGMPTLPKAGTKSDDNAGGSVKVRVPEGRDIADNRP